jgi:hypothetical protein
MKWVEAMCLHENAGENDVVAWRAFQMQTNAKVQMDILLRRFVSKENDSDAPAKSWKFA